MIKWSIITLTRDRYDAIALSSISVMQSIVNKLRYDIEYIIVDNNSYENNTEMRKELDEHFDKIKEYSCVKIIKAKDNKLTNRNLGIEVAAGQYIVNVDDDVVITSLNWLDELYKYLKNDDVGAVGQMGMYFYPDWSNYTNGFARSGEICDCLMGFCWAWKNNGYKMSVDWGWHEEAEMQCQIQNDGLKLVCCDRVCFHNQDGNAVTINPTKTDMSKHDNNLQLVKDRWYNKLKNVKLYGERIKYE